MAAATTSARTLVRVPADCEACAASLRHGDELALSTGNVGSQKAPSGVAVGDARDGHSATAVGRWHGNWQKLGLIVSNYGLSTQLVLWSDEKGMDIWKNSHPTMSGAILRAGFLELCVRDFRIAMSF